MVPLFIRGIITLLLLCGMTALIWLLSTHSIPPDNTEVVYMLTGIIGTLTTLSVNWWFGSSKGSSDKNALLNNTVT